MQKLNNLLAVYCEDKDKYDEAQALAVSLSLPFQQEALVQLCWVDNKWVLKKQGCLPVSVDFDIYQWRKGGKLSRQEGLIRACKPQPGSRITDLTAGLARDAALLAYYGATLTLIEKDRVMGVLLEDGIKRGLAQGFLFPGQITLIISDAKDYLKTLTAKDFPDVIYYDPMHPSRSKSAKVKKTLQCLQAWMQPDVDLLEVLGMAKTHVKERVVMKWPAREASLDKVNYQIGGKTIRFDVYLRSN